MSGVKTRTILPQRLEDSWFRRLARYFSSHYSTGTTPLATTLDCSTIVLAISMGSCGPQPFRFELMWLRKMPLLMWLVVGRRGFVMTGKGFFLMLKTKLKEWKD